MEGDIRAKIHLLVAASFRCPMFYICARKWRKTVGTASASQCITHRVDFSIESTYALKRLTQIQSTVLDLLKHCGTQIPHPSHSILHRHLHLQDGHEYIPHLTTTVKQSLDWDLEGLPGTLS
jgi:hypothetical protein